MNKEEQASIAERCGMHIPYGKVFQKTDPINWDVFPCIVKPISSVNGGGKKDILICNNKDELELSLQKVESSTIQIQEFISKDMEYQLIGCSLDAGNKIIIPGFTNIIRQPPNTNTGYLVYSPISELRFGYEAVRKFLLEIGYSGLFSMEFIRGKNDIDYFLEINMRNDGNAYCVKTAGINLPYIWCYYQIHKELPSVSLTFEKPVWFIPDFADMRLGISKEGFFKWVYQFFKADSHAIYKIGDMKPFVVKMLQLIKKCILTKV
jgi:D-aspartate ligase